MSIKYILNEMANPLKREEPKKWYARAKSTGETTLKGLSKEIAQRSTVSPADTQAVLVSLTEMLVEHLADGDIVRLGDVGSFQIGISSEGAETQEKFNTSLIKSAKVVFRPGTDIKNMLATLKFEKA